MKPMPKTNSIAYSLDYIIDTYMSFTKVNNYYNPFNYTAEELADETTAIVNKLQTIETADIKNEFSTALDSFEEIIPLRHIMEVNFKKLLDWKYNSTAEYTANEQELSEETEEFMISFYNEGNVVTVVDKETICNNYLKIGYHITFLKLDLIKLLAQWKDMGAPFSKIGTEKIYQNLPLQKMN